MCVSATDKLVLITIVFAGRRVRSEAVGRLAWFLTSETDSVGKLPQFSALDVGGLADLLQVEFPRALLLESPGASVFQVGISSHHCC